MYLRAQDQRHAPGGRIPDGDRVAVWEGWRIQPAARP
jgi:hypothetical protein